MARLFRFDLFGPDFKWIAPLGAIEAVEGKIRANAISDMAITVPASHKRAAKMAEPGTRIRTMFRGEQIISGPLRARSGGMNSSLVFDCQSDWRILHNFLGFVNPTERVANGLLLKQGEEEKDYYTIGRRPAETVVKDVARRNIVERRGYPLTIAPDKGRGKVMEASFRMHPLYDRLFPAVEEAGLVVTVQQGTGGLVLDVIEPKPYPTVLTVRSRVIQNWAFDGTGPEATSGVLGGQGVGDLREFLAFRDPAREAEWGDVIEIFKDARDTSDSATHAQRANSALFESAPTSSLTLELAEAGNFQVLGPKGLRPGQLVTARLNTGQVFTDLVSEVNFSWNRDDGLKLSATIGPKDDPDDNLYKALTALARGLLDMKAGY